MKRDVLTDPNPILREPAKPVENFDMQLQTIIDDMVETMRANNGVGLAAPQIGLSKQIIVCELESEEKEEGAKVDNGSFGIYEPFPLTVLCNPEIISESKDKCKIVEGCLSFPGMELVVDRPVKIHVKAKDRYGMPIEVKANKLFSRVLQHELDHLSSTLLIDHLKEISVVFFASGDFGLKALEFLHKDKQYTIKAVITTSQISISRGEQKDNNKIKKLAKILGIKIIEIESLKKADVLERIKKLKAEIGVVVDFGLMIPDPVINAFKYKILNIHPSILPKYRGSSPIQATILNGDRYAGVTVMQISKRMDAGPIVSQYKVKLKGKETTKILKDYLADLGATILLDTLPYYISGEILPKEQKETRASYTPMITKADGEVKPGDDPKMIERKIRAYNPWPGVFTINGNLRIGLTAAHLDREKKFVIDRVKPAGKNEMAYSDFLNGYRRELTFGENIDKINAN